MESFDNNEANEPLLESKARLLDSVEKVSSQLEDTLSDSTLSWWIRIRKATVIEFGYLYRLAAPAIVVYLLNNVISMSTQIFCGHLGNLELAASSLSNNGIQLMAYGLMVN